MKMLSKNRVIFVLLALVGTLFGSLAPLMLPSAPSAIAVEEAPSEEPSSEPNAENTDTNTTPNTAENTEDQGTNDENEENQKNQDQPKEDETVSDTPICQGQSGAVSWFLCPLMNAGSNFLDRIYEFIESFLDIAPLSTDTESPIFKVWVYMRDLTNIVFIIFIIVVLYSQFTGLGISNYGIKRVLPRLIIAIIMVNLSYILCTLLIDASNLIGSSIGGFLTGIKESIQQTVPPELQVSWTEFIGSFTITAAGTIVGVASVGGIEAAFWMAVVAVLGAVISLVIGFITISLRQGVISILVMISPLAFVAYLLPNTEKWFDKWKNALFQMVFFYPMFAFLVGASNLAGWAIIASAEGEPFEVLLGLAVQILPLCLSAPMMKMSGSMLGRISSGLDRLTNPARNTLGRWGDSHTEKARQHSLRNNRVMTGARLRNYLAYRQKRRDLDAMRTKSINEGRAITRALNEAAGYKGLDAEGNAKYKSRGSKEIRRAKEAKLQETLVANAQKMLDNNLADYDKTFEKDRAGKAISALHAAAFEDSMMQTFRAQNIAQGDQNYLLNRYMTASKDRNRTPYDFNRLLKNANGGLGMDGIDTIMGQVLRQSVEIEGRNRRDALVVANKFNFSKPEFRNFAFDVADMSDAGFEMGPDGKPVEDDQYHLIAGKQHRQWNKYIGVHKETGKEITKEQYDSLSDAERRAYKRVRYMDIYDDDGDVIQQFTENDAGFMKEMLARDIAINDPINDRYNVSYGLGGPLRRYHSTISAAMGTAKYGEHAVEAGNMLLQQLNMGYVDTPGKYNIAALQSAAVATKPKNFLINDKHAFQRYQKLFESLGDEAKFQKYFPDQDILDYLDVNGKPLDGLRFNSASQAWEEIPRESSTIEDLRNTIKHKIMPKTIKQFINHLKTKPTPNIRENQKASGVAALIELANFISALGIQNEDPSIPIEQRLDPQQHLFGEAVGAETNKIIENAMRELNSMLGEAQTREQSGRINENIQKFTRDLNHANSTVADASEQIEDLITSGTNDPRAIAELARSIFSENAGLREYSGELEQLIASALYDERSQTTEDAINNTAEVDYEARQEAKADAIRDAISQLYNTALGASINDE